MERQDYNAGGGLAFLVQGESMKAWKRWLNS